MAALQNIGLMKVLGVFGTAIILFLLVGSILFGVIKGVRTGDWKSALQESGGRIFATDLVLSQETDFLLTAEDTTSVTRNFHLAYSLFLLGSMLFVGFAMFKFLNWLSGQSQFSPLVDVMIVLFIIGVFLGAQFLYTHYVLNEDIVPLSGVWKFVTNLPAIFERLTT